MQEFQLPLELSGSLGQQRQHPEHPAYPRKSLLRSARCKSTDGRESLRKGLDSYRLPPGWNPITKVHPHTGEVEHNPSDVDHLNRILVEIQNRLDTIQQVGVKKPATPLSPSATGRQGLIWLTWNRVTNVDGYSVVVATTSDMSKVLHRQDIPGSETCSYPFPIGNNVATYYFQVFSHRGNTYSTPSNIVSATSLAYTTPEATLPAPPVDPRNPLQAPLRNGTTLT